MWRTIVIIITPIIIGDWCVYFNHCYWVRRLLCSGSHPKSCGWSNSHTHSTQNKNIISEQFMYKHYLF